MIERAMLLAMASELFDRIIVSSDDDEILSIAESHFIEAHRRSESMSRNDVGTQEVMKHVLVEMDVRELHACCLYPCVPLLRPSDLIYARHMLLFRPCNYVVAVATDPLRDIGNFYWGQTNAFRLGEELYSDYTGIYVVEKSRAIDINTEDDWKMAEKMYSDETNRALAEYTAVNGELH